MNYSRNIRKKAIAKRVIISWVIVAVVSVMIGGLSGYALKTHITAKQDNYTESVTVAPVPTESSLYDGITKEFQSVQPYIWKGQSDFKPLDVAMEEDEQEFVYYMASAYSIDFSLIMAVISRESDFEPSAVSSTGDYGLMQINECNHDYITDTLGVTDFLDPYQNIASGVFILKQLFNKYDDPAQVLMVYNMGEDGASKLWNKNVYETDYTERIFEIQEQYYKQLEGDRADAGELESN